MVWWVAQVASQNVLLNYTTPADLMVCDTAPFSVSITNNGSITLSGNNLNVMLPPGVTYIPGSITGGTQLNISNLENPTFGFINVPVGATRTLAFKARASCALINDINMGAQFSNTITHTYNGGNQTVVTNPYPIETPLIVLLSGSGLDAFGQAGQTITRTFTIRNNRIGALESFSFTDAHMSGGFTVSTNYGTVLQNTGTFLELRIDGNDFQQIGDGDALFELNEVITITETLLVTSCGVGLNQSISTIGINWGCGTENCQQIPIMAKLNILPSDANPTLEFAGIANLIEDLCGNLPTRQSVTITNTGNGAAVNAEFELFVLEGGLQNDLPWAGFDTTTMRLDSAGVSSELYPFAANALALFDCPTNGIRYQRVKFALPLLPPGTSVTASWDMYACSQECVSDLPGWQVTYKLPRLCPPGVVDSAFGIGPAPLSIELANNPDWQICIKEALLDDQEYDIIYTLNATLLADSVGRVRVSFEMPCGMSWSGQPFLINNIAPVDLGSYALGDNTVQWFEFTTPFNTAMATGIFRLRWDCDAVCPGLIDDCVYGFDAANCENGCDANPDALPKTLMRMVTEFRLRPGLLPGCGIKNCLEYEFTYYCGGATACATTPKGWIEHSSSIKRTSYGRADNNGDRLPDPGNPPVNLNQIRTDRFLPGDTSESFLRGVVQTNQPGATFTNALLRTYFETHAVDGGIDDGSHQPYYNEGDISTLEATLRIRDAETGQVTTCNLNAPDVAHHLEQEIKTPNVNYLACQDTLNYIYYMFHNWDISPVALATEGCILPAGFAYSQGDSIELRTVNRFMANPIDQLHVNMRVKTFASVYNAGETLPPDNTAPPKDFSCNCPYNLIQITPVVTRITRSKYVFQPCENSDAPLQPFFEVKLSKNDFFPFEYRPVLHPQTWTDNVPQPVTGVIMEIDVYKRQDSSVVNTNINLPFNVLGENYTANLSTQPIPDEGFTWELYRLVDGPCYWNTIKPLITNIQSMWLPPSPRAGQFDTDSLTSAIDLALNDTFGFYPKRPSLLAISSLGSLVDNDNTAEWDITVLHGGDAVTAPNAWIYLANPAGGLSNYQLLELPGFVSVPLVNGFFQLGDFQPGEVRMYKLKALNSSCDLQTLDVQYGWNCTVIENFDEFPCQQKVLRLNVQTQPAELELGLTTPPGPFYVCDTTGYHVAEVFNALYGAAYNVQLQFNLPPGLALLPGSCQMSYPIGSAYTNIPDPQVLGGGWRGWKLADLNGALANLGLRGFPEAPLHGAGLRFRTISTCGLGTGEKIIYRTFGEQNCADSTNLLVKPGETIELEGVVEPYESYVTVTSAVPLPVNCDAPIPINLSVVPQSNTLPEDSLFVLLPPGVNFVAGSYQPGANAVGTPPLVTTVYGQQQLAWPLLPNLTAGATISMAINTAGYGSRGCGITDTVLVRATQQQNAECVVDGTECFSNATTGSGLLLVPVSHPQLEFTNFSITLEGNVPFFNITVKNAGTLPYNDVSVFHFYTDADGSGSVSAGDVLQFTHSAAQSIVAGQSVNVGAVIGLDLADLCHLLVTFDSTAACLCANDALNLQTLKRNLPDEIVCSGESVTLGVPGIAGHVYQWQPSGPLSCGDCSQPIFSMVNMGAGPESFETTFTESAGNCVVSAEQSITVLPLPRILSPDTMVCRDQTVVLSATPGATTYLWDGPDITDPTQQNPVVTPEATAVYTVFINNPGECDGQDSVLVTVLPTPTTLLPDTLGKCGNDTLRLQAPVDAQATYLWAPAGLFDNPNIANPNYVGSGSAVLTLTMSYDNGCSDEANVQVINTGNPVLQLSMPSVTNCIGDSTLLSISGTDTYVWAPSGGIACTGTSGCAQVFVFPSETTLYTVTGTNALGCSSMATVQVTVPGAVQETSENRETCLGEPVLIFGEWQTEAGNYCSTFSNVAGCDSVHCIALTVLDTVYKEERGTVCSGVSIILGGIEYTQPGVYCQTLPGVNGCDSTYCAVVEAAVLPVIDTFIRVTALEDQVLSLDQLPDDFLTYNWSPWNELSCRTCANPTLNALPGVDSITLTVTVTTEGGCEQVILYRVRFLPPCDEANAPIPNAFTPNGDGVNDVFSVATYEGFEIVNSYIIYSRWGQKVYESPTPWTGDELPSDVYVYMISVGCPTDEKVRMRKGEVTLMR